mmetsp:Transcript_107615/g.213818  ORF Transcript_107615/g.213818 Transcript_107615/m.213818 type:complete len:101 (+) Transcript_107615:3607-3909(+)
MAAAKSWTKGLSMRLGIAQESCPCAALHYHAEAQSAIHDVIWRRARCTAASKKEATSYAALISWSELRQGLPGAWTVSAPQPSGVALFAGLLYCEGAQMD